MVGVTVRLTRPSRSKLRSVSVSIRCDTLGISRLSSLNRLLPSPRVETTSTVHLSPMRASKVLIVLQTGFAGSFIGTLPVPALHRCSRRTNLFVQNKKVRSCEQFLGGYLACLGNKSIPRRQ